MKSKSDKSRNKKEQWKLISITNVSPAMLNKIFASKMDQWVYWKQSYIVLTAISVILDWLNMRNQITLTTLTFQGNKII